MHLSIPPQPRQAISAADPAVRSNWRLLESLPDRLRLVERWRPRLGEPWPGDGHLHAVPTLAACLTGVVRLRRGATHTDLHAGEALLVAPGVWHRHEPLRAGSAACGLGLLLGGADLLLAGDGRRWTGRLAAEPTRRLLEEALAVEEAGPRLAATVSLLRQVVAEPMSDLAIADAAVERMLEVLHRRLPLGLSVEELLEASGRSAAQARRLAATAWGAPPRQVLGDLRLRLAQALLDAGMDVASVSMRAGYSSLRAFQRAWSAAYGAPPRTARRRR